MLRFAGGFAAIVLALFAAELTTPAQRYVVDPWTGWVARAATWMASVFDANVIVQGATILHATNGFAVTILAGCNGVEAMIVLIAAIVAYPASWKQRAVGIAVGFVAIQALNMVRIVSLFYIGQWSPRLFEWAHLYAWQALIMLDVLVVWLLWLRTLSRPRSPNPAH